MVRRSATWALTSDNMNEAATQSSSPNPWADQPENELGLITYYPPVLVVCRVNDTTAIWQVETDPNVTAGDFSGAWLVTAEGIKGFAAGAEWIENRDDPAAMAELLLANPVIITEESEGDVTYGGAADAVGSASGGAESGASAAESGAGVGPRMVDLAATHEAGQAAIAEAKARFESESPGKRQPAWGTIRSIEPIRPQAHGDGDSEGQATNGLRDVYGEDADKAVTSVLAMARGVRMWARDWTAFDKIRAKRLAGRMESGSEKVRFVPLRFDR